MIGAPGLREVSLPILVAGKRGQVAVSYYGSKNAPLPFPPLCITGVLAIGSYQYPTETASLSCPAYANETWDTYVTETWNALDRQPLFWSATLNDPAQPTWYGLSPSALRLPEPPPGVTGPNARFAVGANALPGFAGPAGSGHIDYYAMTMAPDGTAWVGFPQECPFGLPVSGNPICPSTLMGAPTDGLFGFVGRLVRVHDESDEDDDED
jgi:hypothetical protein